MKLRNKKTGEIRDFIINKNKIQTTSAIDCWEYNSLAELNAEWEDYEEPKEYWYIGENGKPYVFPSEHYIFIDNAREVGNYFETEEEAEKAVEKLKAWQRLKEARFEFGTSKYNLDEESSNTIAYDGIVTFKGIAYEDFVDDLNLIFGQ